MNRGFGFFNRFGRDFRTFVATGLATSSFITTLNNHAFSEGANNFGDSHLVTQPSFGLASTNSSRMKRDDDDDEPLDLTLIGGTFTLFLLQ